MWNMFETDFFDCGEDACDGPGPPPKFHLPPPPRPPFMQELSTVGAGIECNDDAMLDVEMCAAFPNLDANYRNSSTLQTSAIIAVCSIALLLVILFSSFFLWKHKRKMQNFWPCKSLQKRNGHLDTSGVSSSGGGHSVAYEDPDAHLHHRPLVMRHHNMEMLHPKSIHFPSGYPIARSPPLFVCSSPGPDPYRSLDNVYEELDAPRDSDMESEPRVHSDDDFAEDELSLNGGAVQPYHISSPTPDGVHISLANTTAIPMITSSSTCATISQTIPSISTIYSGNNNTNYGSDNENAQMQSVGNGNGNGTASVTNELERGTNDRNSLISSSSSSASTAPANDCAVGHASSSNSSCSSGPTRIASPDSGLALRNRTSRMRNFSVDKLNCTSADGGAPSIRSNDNGGAERNHLMTLPYNQHHLPHHHHHHNQYHRNNNNLELNHSNNNNNILSNHLNNVNNNVNSNSRLNNNSSGNSASKTTNGNVSNGSTDVERHNQINKQLSSEHPLLQQSSVSANRLPTSNYPNHMAKGNRNHHHQDPTTTVSTIFPGRLINSNSNLSNYHRIQLQNQYYTPSDSVRCAAPLPGNNRSRTNPRTTRQRCSGNTLPLAPYTYQNDNACSYAEPVFRDDLFDACSPPLLAGYRTVSTSQSNGRNHHDRNNMNYPSSYYQEQCNGPDRDLNSQPRSRSGTARVQPIYSHDSSFGSDSGYSQYTHNSRSKSSDGSNNSAQSGGNSRGNIAGGALSNVFAWTRRKDHNDQPQANRNKSSAKSTLRSS